MRRTTGFAVVAGLTMMSAPALASDRGSVEDQLACTPDVYRLCSKYIPDEDAIVSCLQRNLASLSPACQRVFSSPQGQGDKSDE